MYDQFEDENGNEYGSFETFYVSADEFVSADEDSVFGDMYQDELEKELRSDSEDPENLAARNLSGWYWWSCFPGCLPDNDPVGPFDTEDEAIEDAKN